MSAHAESAAERDRRRRKRADEARPNVSMTPGQAETLAEASSAATSVDVRLIRDGRFMWGWVVSVGVETVSCDVLPRFSQKSARRAAERAARRWARRGAPRERRYSVDV